MKDKGEPTKTMRHYLCVTVLWRLGGIHMELSPSDTIYKSSVSPCLSVCPDISLPMPLPMTGTLQQGGQ